MHESRLKVTTRTVIALAAFVEVALNVSKVAVRKLENVRRVEVNEDLPHPLRTSPSGSVEEKLHWLLLEQIRYTRRVTDVLVVKRVDLQHTRCMSVQEHVHVTSRTYARRCKRGTHLGIALEQARGRVVEKVVRNASLFVINV